MLLKQFCIVHHVLKGSSVIREHHCYVRDVQPLGQQTLDTWYVSKWFPQEYHDPRFPSRTLPNPAAIPSAGKQRTWPSTWSKRICDFFFRPGFFHWPMVQFWCTSSHCRRFFSTVGRVHRGNCNALCSDIFLSWPAYIKCFSSFSYSISDSVWSNPTGQPSLPNCISKPWVPMNLMLVHWLSFLGPV